MPEWAQELLRNHPQLVVAITLATTCYAVFAWLEDRLSADAKKELTAWLKSVGDIASTQSLSLNLSRFHCQLFGEKQFSIKCFLSALLFSFLSFFLMSFATLMWQISVANTYEKIPISSDEVHISVSAFQWIVITVVMLLLMFLIIVFPLDFMGIGITRRLASRVRNDISLKAGLFIFFLDTIVKTIIFPFIMVISGIVILLFFALTVNYISSGLLLTDMSAHLAISTDTKALSIFSIFSTSSIGSIFSTLLVAFEPTYSIMIPSFLLCSAWVWLYLIGLHVVPRAVGVFDVEKQPVRSIGIFGAAVLTACYLILAVIQRNTQLSVYYTIYPQDIAILFNQDYDRAITHYSKLIERDPASSGAFKSRGAAYFAKGDYEHATADFNEAIRLDPKLAAELTNAFGNGGVAYVEKNEYDHAIADFSAAIRLDPTSPKFFYQRGKAYDAKQDYGHAIADYSEAIRLDPKNASAFYNRGNAFAGKQDYDHAIADLSEAIRLDPKNASAFYNRGNAYSYKQDYDHAIADYSEAIRLDPKDASAFYNRGNAYARKQDYERAIANFSEAIRLDPKDASAFYNRGLAYALKQDYDHAIANFSEAIRLDPKHASALFNRGLAYASKQDHEHAIADYSEAIRLDPKHASALFNRGLAYASKQDHEHAIADYSEAIRLDPKNAYPILWLYLARMRIGARNAAAELEVSAKSLSQPDWPYPIVELFLGRRTPEAALAAPAKSDERCEAQFYVGEWRLLRGDRRAATTNLKAAMDDSCPKSLVEFEAARAELKRLEARP